MTKRILITGDRNWTDGDAIVRRLEKLKPTKDDILIHGAAKGVDTFGSQSNNLNERIAYADLVGKRCGFGRIIPFPADWDRFHRAAGPIRNTQMLKEGKPTFALAFHPNILESRGTKNMILQLGKAGIIYRLFDE